MENLNTIELFKRMRQTLRKYAKTEEDFELLIDIDAKIMELEITKRTLNVFYGIKNAFTSNDLTAHIQKIMRNSIKKIIFNDPATIIIWGNGDKTIVKCGEGEFYDPEKGMAMAIAKHFLGDKGNYYKTFKKWLPKENETVKESKSNTERFISIRDFCNRCNITKNKVYRMIKAGDIYAIKNERGHWMIDTTAGVIKYM